MSIKGIRKNILLGIIMGSISFTLLACNKKEIKSVMDKNEVIVGLDDAFAPMGFKDESGEIVGFDVDLAKAVVDGAPKVLKEAASKAEAEDIKTKLEAEGAKVTLK